MSEKLLPKDLQFKSFQTNPPHFEVHGTGIEVTHTPTGISVRCDEMRQPHQNRARAMQLLEEILEKASKWNTRAAEQPASGGEPVKLQFPTMLRKMWSGIEVQKWLDDLGPLYTEAQITAAFEAEIARVSTVEYNSNEICRHFFAELKTRLLETSPTHTEDSGRVEGERERIESAAKLAGVRGKWDHFRNQFRLYADPQEMFLGEAWIPSIEPASASGVQESPAYKLFFECAQLRTKNNAQAREIELLTHNENALRKMNEHLLEQITELESLKLQNAQNKNISEYVRSQLYFPDGELRESCEIRASKFLELIKC